MRMDSKYPHFLQLIYNYFIICCNLNIEFATKYEVQGPNEAKNVFRCETHFHKWGKVQRMKPNDSQVHSHFGSCTRVEVVNV
jgi:hypothetical protein